MNSEIVARQRPAARAEGDVVPQAIFWRPIEYFSAKVRSGEDELDSFRFATYGIGNQLTFDLRHYAGHPARTVTMYLPLSISKLKDIREATTLVVGGLLLPTLAVAWRRGEPFEYGRLERPARDRLREPEARLLALKIAAGMPDRRASTQQLIERASKFFVPSSIDLQPSSTRPLQPQWHQIIRNVISHRGSPHGPFQLGYAERTANGLFVTEAGIDYLRSRGYLV